jgi:predicted alpha/beta-hydrolase family hydrolase
VVPYVLALRRRGLDVEAVELPFGPVEKAAAVFEAQAGPEVVAAGVSFGGRAATLAAARADLRAAIAISYPLRDSPDERTAHWPAVRCPVLVVNGDRDELADPADLAARMPLLSEGRLELIPGLGHDLSGRADDVAGLVAAFLGD